VHGDRDGQVFQSASAASANTTAARSPVTMSGSLASSNPSHTNKAIQALSTRKARTAQDVRCRRCKAAASRGGVGFPASTGGNCAQGQAKPKQGTPSLLLSSTRRQPHLGRISPPFDWRRTTGETLFEVRGRLSYGRIDA